MFPDLAGENPVYNTVDGTLWYINAVLKYVKYTGDFNFIQKELWTTLNSIIENHVHGTLFDIHMENDGLLAHGPRLTWMDVMVGGRIITPREGKAVEIQALWYNALKTMEMLAKRFAKREEEKYSGIAEKARRNFLKKFWKPQNGYLLDVVSGQQGDASVRPNQVIAVALDFSMVNKTIGKEVVETVWKRLWGTYGLKTLAADDPRYLKVYLGEQIHRDTAYHNGTIWAWPLGPFVTAFLKVKNYEEHWRNFAFESFLKPLFHEKVFEAGLGTLSEVFEPEPPHQSRGCISQAWSVAEPLRAYVEDVLYKRPPHERQMQRLLRD
jgi:predicted glycogen debranching enzyme